MPMIDVYATEALFMSAFDPQSAEGRDRPDDVADRVAQYDAVRFWGVPNHGLLSRVGAIAVPTLVANGDSDPMILPRYSQHSRRAHTRVDGEDLADSAHGFLFQRHTEFGDDMLALLSE